MSQQWPGIEALPPRLPGIEASSLPSLHHTKVGIPTSLSHRGRNSDFAFCPKNPSPGQRRRSVSESVLAGPLAECFFHHSHAQPSILAWAQDCPTQSWRGHRIAPLNPGVGTASILAWAQDCPGVSHKTLEVQCCTALRPQTRRPDCAENTGSASVHSDALPDSPPGLPGKLRKRTAV